jgi:arylformamidase
MAAGASVNVSTITTSPHVGTHADAPLHVRPSAPGAHALPLAAFYGPALVVDLSDCTGSIEEATLMERYAQASAANPLAHGEPTPPARLLLKTGHTIANGTFPNAWPALSPACAERLTARGLILLGVDAPSVDDRESKTLAVHHALFDHGASVLENLDLRTVNPGRYELIAFPTKLADLDAAPVRAVLRPLPSQR